MQLSARLRALIVAALGLALIVGVMTALQIAPGAPTTAVPGQAIEQSTKPGATAQPTPATIRATPAARPTATATPAQPVALSLASVEQEPSQGGVIVTLDVANRTASALNFQLAPENDLQVTDAAGREWPLRWASYNGGLKVPAGQSTQLVRAFIAGDLTHARWPLTVTARHVPQVGEISWKVDQQGKPTLASVSAPVVLPTLAAGGPVQLSLANVQPSSQLGGIQADLMLQNNQSSDLVFRFDPNDQVSARDSLGRPYSVRWAAYGGVVHVAPHQSVRLAQVFLAGPLDNGNPTWLQVSVKQVPSTKPLEAVTRI